MSKYNLILVLLLTSYIAGSLQIPNGFKNVDQMIDYINSTDTTWKAGKNFDDKYTLEYLKGLLGVRHSGQVSYDDSEPVVYEDLDIPESFDSRQQWPECRSLKVIRDQGACGSCWAVSTVSAISDRICIASKGKQQVEISVEDLLSCTHIGSCAHGGEPWYAHQEYIDRGLVSGGDYDSHEGCLPYTIAPCEHVGTGHYPPCPMTLVPTPQCENKCEAGYNGTYAQDKHFGSKRTLFANKPKDVQLEIMTNGPVVADFGVYEDFFEYKSGVYQHVTGQFAGNHAVRILGWGVENGVDYWLVANSWNEDWGDKGYFKIKRGNDECAFESLITSSLPKL